MEIPPLLDTWAQLQAAVDPLVGDLVSTPGVLDLDAATEAIDLASQQVLAPQLVEDSESASPDSEE